MRVRVEWVQVVNLAGKVIIYSIMRFFECNGGKAGVLYFSNRKIVECTNENTFNFKILLKC